LARRRKSPVEDLIEIISTLPWWVGATLAVVSYFLLHNYSEIKVDTSGGISQMGSVVAKNITVTLAKFGQYILPGFFGLGALISFVKSGQIKTLFNAVKSMFSADNRKISLSRSEESFSESYHLDTASDKEIVLTPPKWTHQVLASLEWKRFETICAEYLRMKGFDPKETRIGADGGVDINLYKDGIEKPVGIVQCKAWNTYMVGVKPVRELFGVMAAEDINLGIFMTSGVFTSEAIVFAEGKPLELISGVKLLAEIKKLTDAQQSELLEIALAGDYRTPTCPQCGIKMTLRYGTGSYKKFWGCQKYPKCRSTLVFKPESV